MSSRRITSLLAPVFALALLGAACGDDDDASVGAVDEPSGVDDTGGGDGDDDADAGADDDGGDDREGTPGASGTATLTLANGEQYEFSILCSLEPQIAAGQEIAFSITSYDEPYGFDATKFGDDAVMPGLTSIDVYDSETYEAVWQASSVMGDVELELSGNTVTGTGTFFEGDEGLGDGVEGELTASC
jgi:hypothetical protein